MRWHADAFFRRASVALRVASDGSLRLTPQSLASVSELEDLHHALAALGAFRTPEETPELVAIIRRSGEIAEQLELLVRADRSDHVYWAEVRGRGLFLRAAPIEVGEDFRQRLYASVDTLVFTSATITAEASTFSPFEKVTRAPEPSGSIRVARR